MKLADLSSSGNCEGVWYKPPELPPRVCMNVASGDGNDTTHRRPHHEDFRFAERHRASHLLITNNLALWSANIIVWLPWYRNVGGGWGVFLER